jgi:hypothetical protein
MYRQPLPARIGQGSVLAILAVLWTAPAPQPARAQQPQLGNLLPCPRLNFVTPCGGKAGTTVEVTFNGTDVEAPEQLLFSHPDIKATPVVPPQPKPDPKKPAPPPPPVTAFKVTIGEKVPVGTYDVRLVNKWGVSNPRAFAVGDLAEVMEKEPNDDVDKAQRVALDSTVNGTLSSPVDVDYYAFAAKKGQRVVVSCLGSSIDSRLDPELRLYDAKGKQLAVNRQYRGRDALVEVRAERGGDYYVRVCHFTYTEGNPEFFYRLSISTAPWIDAVHPAVIEPGKSAEVTVYGRNLPGGKPDRSAVVDGRVLETVRVTIQAPDGKAALHRVTYRGLKRETTLSLDGFEYRIRTEKGTSNPFLITYAQAPVVLDNEANDTPETAQQVTLPCEIAGRVEKRRDRDWYEFSAKKGEVYNIEVFSDRLGSPTDMYFVLRDAKTKQELVEIDQNSEMLNQSLKFYAVTEDPGVHTFAVPADGKYQLMVASREADTLAGPRHLYRVRITAPRPDFHVALMPVDNYRTDSAVLRRGGQLALHAFVWRHDGWAGDVTLTAEDLPKGVMCPAQSIGSGVRVAKVVLSAATDAPAWTGTIKFKAAGKVNGKEVVRECRYAGITWTVPPQQLIRLVTRFDDSLVLAVRELQAPYSLTTGLDKATVTQGGKVTVPLKLARLWADFKNPVTLFQVPQELPPNLVAHGQATIAASAATGTIDLNVNPSAQPGTYNIVFRTAAVVPFNKDPKAAKQPVNVVEYSSPFALTIVPKQVATVSLNNTNPTAKIGGQAEVVVQVQRQFNYDGEFKVQLVLPGGVQGLTADEATIPAGKNEAKLVIKAAANAAPGNRPNLVVKTTAKYSAALTLTQEVKINVNVVK